MRYFLKNAFIEVGSLIKYVAKITIIYYNVKFTNTFLRKSITFI